MDESLEKIKKIIASHQALEMVLGKMLCKKLTTSVEIFEYYSKCRKELGYSIEDKNRAYLLHKAEQSDMEISEL